jgi:hypothetical protein
LRSCRKLDKIYIKAQDEVRYSPAECIGTHCEVISGDPFPPMISTSMVERQNLTMRMNMRRFTRLTNGFSKKIENHLRAIASHYIYYDFARIHKRIRRRRRLTLINSKGKPMRKTLGACLLALLLTGSASAGIMQNNSLAPPPPPANAAQGPTTDGDISTMSADSLTRLALDLLAALPSLL